MTREQLYNYYQQLQNIAREQHQSLRDVVVDTQKRHHTTHPDQLSTEGTEYALPDSVLAAISLRFRRVAAIQDPQIAAQIYQEILTTYFGNP